MCVSCSGWGESEPGPGQIAQLTDHFMLLFSLIWVVFCGWVGGEGSGGRAKLVLGSEKRAQIVCECLCVCFFVCDYDYVNVLGVLPIHVLIQMDTRYENEQV